jgi:hypothetical protein
MNTQMLKNSILLVWSEVDHDGHLANDVFPKSLRSLDVGWWPWILLLLFVDNYVFFLI